MASGEDETIRQMTGAIERFIVLGAAEGHVPLVDLPKYRQRVVVPTRIYVRPSKAGLEYYQRSFVRARPLKVAQHLLAANTASSAGRWVARAFMTEIRTPSPGDRLA